MLIFAFRNSVGNVIDIMSALDAEKYTKPQIEANYKELVERWGIWQIIGGESGGLGVTFIDIRHAMFNGLSITYLTVMFVSFALAVILGKILLPKLAKYYEESNESMVDIATLRTNEIMNERKQEKEKIGRWF